MMSWSARLERLLLILGLLMMAIYVGAHIHKEVLSRTTLDRFKTEELRLADQTGSEEVALAKPDFSLWSEKRIKGYEESLATHFSPAIGILRIPKIHLEVPILEGTDDLTLNRGTGRIQGSARLGADGNIGIAGHRDGFFRGLKDIGPGDTIEIITPRRTKTYIVDHVVIVDPQDISVLSPRERPSVTLVTCFPFYFVGSAPKRYIVQASLQNNDLANDPGRELRNQGVRIQNTQTSTR